MRKGKGDGDREMKKQDRLERDEENRTDTGQTGRQTDRDRD